MLLLLLLLCCSAVAEGVAVAAGVVARIVVSCEVVSDSEGDDCAETLVVLSCSEVVDVACEAVGGSVVDSPLVAAAPVLSVVLIGSVLVVEESVVLMVVVEDVAVCDGVVKSIVVAAPVVLVEIIDSAVLE